MATVFAMAVASEEAAEEAGRCLAFLADRGEAEVELAESRDRGGGRATPWRLGASVYPSADSSARPWPCPGLCSIRQYLSRVPCCMRSL